MLLYKHNTKPYDFLNRYLNIRITNSFEEFKEYSGEKFFMVTIFDIWLSNNTDNKLDIIWETIFSEELIQELRTKKYPIIFENASEWCTKSNFDALENFCNYIGFSPNDVYICLANSLSVNLSINLYPTLKKYNFLSVERFAFDAVQVGYTMGDLLYKFKFDSKKRFLFLNRRYSSERAFLYFNFHKLNLLDNMHSTFGLDNIYDDNIVTLDYVTKDIERTHNISGQEVVDYIKMNNNQLESSLPHKIKTNNPIYNTKKIACIYTFWNLAAHNSTDINIITETFRYCKDTDIHHKTIFFITEKTYRTILMKQPFILFSNPYALKYLKDAGYKTFSPFIDESYDNIENLADRQNAIINEVQRLNSMEESEFNELLKNCKVIAEHNYNNLMERASNKHHNTAWTNDRFRDHLLDIDKTLKPANIINLYNVY